jgi:MarR family transcriptional regulator, organic hydroperoxide resistance regulator
MTDDVPSADVERIGTALRGWYGAFNELGREFSAHVGAHSSDAAALVQISSAEDRGAPLTQAQLSRRIGLTPAATSALLNRLERAGHVRRHRDQRDRRVVTLRSTEAMHEQVHAFFREVSLDLDRTAERFPPEIVAACADLVAAMTATLESHLERMTQDRAGDS